MHEILTERMILITAQSASGIERYAQREKKNLVENIFWDLQFI